MPIRLSIVGLFVIGVAVLPAQGLNIVLNYDDGKSNEPGIDPNGTGLISMFQYAESFYQGVFEDSHTLTINFWYENLSGNTLGDHALSSFDGQRETEGNIRIDPNNSWFIDPTPTANTEFTMQQTQWQNLTGTQQGDWYTSSSSNIPFSFETGFSGAATTTGGANGLTDMLSVVIHEIGHALGMSESNDSTVSQTNDGDYDFNPAFIYGQSLAIETANISGDDNDNIAHVENTNALMTPLIPPSTRILPSHSDLFAMASGSSFTQLDVPRREIYGSGDWNDPANWSGNQVPEFNDDAFVRVSMGATTLSADGAANNLRISTGADVFTSSHKLDVSNIATVLGTFASIAVGAGGELEANQVFIQSDAELTMSGGVVDTSTLSTEADTNLSSLLNTNTVDVSTSLTNNGTIEALLNSTLIFQSTAANPWNLDGGGTGSVEATSGDIIFDSGALLGAFQGVMEIGPGHYLRIDEPWTNQGDLILDGGTDFASRARLIGGLITMNNMPTADLVVGGLADIDAGMRIQSGEITIVADGELNFNGATTVEGGEFDVNTGAVMDFNGALTITGGTFTTPAPGIGGHIEIDGPTTYDGRTITLDGIIQQRGNATVADATEVIGGYFDMDGSTGSTTWTVNAPFTLTDIEGIENVDNINTFNGTLNINNIGSIGGGGGLLDVNYALRGGSWTMAGTANLDGSKPSSFPVITVIPTMIDGADLTISGTLNMQDRGSIAALTTIIGQVVTADSNSRLVLTAGDLLNNPNRIEGGTVSGAGILASTPGHALHGYGTISSHIVFDGASDIRADDGQLNITNTILDVGIIGTADDDGVLNVTNVWNANIATAVNLRGGSIIGANIINGTILDPGLINGYGTIAVNQVVNDGKISASGGTLVIDTVQNPDLDGGGNDGIIEAFIGNLVIVDPVTDLFDGTAIVQPGATLTFNGGWTLSSGTLNLNGGFSSVEPAAVSGLSQTLLGTVNVDNSGLFDIPTTFSPTVVVNLPDTLDILRLDQDATVQAGASFIGLGRLSNLADSTLTIEDGAEVSVPLQNSGTLEIGSSPGLATVEEYLQITGSLHIEVDGLAPGTGYDQLTILGDTSLSGELDVSLLGVRYTPQLNDLFDIIAFEGNFSGAFTSVSSPAGSGLGFSLLYESDTVSLLTGLLGDLNADGFVGIEDLNIALGNWNQTVDAGVWLQGDPSGDGFVGIEDLNVVLGNWNAGTSPVDNANVPEPATVAIICVGWLALVPRKHP